MVVGTARLRDMPVDALPEFAPPVVEVQTEALGLSPAEVESLVTVNVEEMLSGVPWLQSIRSKSVTGLSSVVLTFEPGTDIMRARQVVNERLTLSYALPNVSKPPVIIQPVSATGRVMMIGISSKEIDPLRLSVLARWTIKPKLLGVPGVANVAIWGQRLRQLHVQLDPERLREQGVTQEQIIAATGDSLWVSPLTFLKASIPGTGGWVDGPNQRIGIQHNLPIKTPEDLARVPVKVSESKILKLGDVANVVENHPPLIGDALVNDDTGLVLVVEKFPSANTVAVTRAVEQAIAELRLGLPGVTMDSSLFRLGSFVEMSMENLGWAALVGAGLATLALLAFWLQWRVALIALITVPLSLLAAGLVLYLRGTTINTMVLAGLLVALVAIIDDAIVDIENIVRRLRENRGQANPKSSAAVILQASLETRSPLLYATLIALLTVIPVLFIGGIAGAFYKPLVVSYALAILASMAVALAIVPALAFVLMTGKAAERREPALVRVLQSRYEGLLARLLGAPAMTLAVATLIAVTGLAVWPRLQWSQLPAFKERDLLVTWEAAPGTSQAEMQRITARASSELRTIPGVKSVGVHVGRAITGDQVVGLSSGQLWVSLDRKSAYDTTVAAIQQVVDGYPGVHARVQSYLRKTLSEVLTGAPHPIVVRIYGAERDILRRKAEEVRQVLSRIVGVVDPRVENEAEEPHIQVKVDVNAAGQLGLKPGDVRRSAATVFSGIEVGYLFEEQKVFEVVVWSAPQKRQSIDSIRDLLVETPSGDHVRLAGIAEVGIKPTPAVIQREAISNYVDVVAGLQGPDLASVSREIERRLQEVRFPLEYHPELLGEYSERQSAQWRALIVAAIAAAGIFLLLQACFQSWLLAAVLVAALPTALIGGVLAAYAAGGTVTIGSLAGLVAVLAITARSSILLIRHYQHLEQEENQPFGLALMLRGARERLAPTLASALCIGLALAPLVALGDLAGFEVARPLAVVVLGGLVSSTLLVLTIVPVLYWCFGHSRDLQLERVSS